VSLRIEVEQATGLRFPERNGEALIRFEESMEVPRGAEALMRGLYRDPEEVKKGFKSLHQETSSLLEVLMPRRARLKEWLEQLPEQPTEAEKFIRETSEQIQRHDRKVVQLETELMTQLEQAKWEDLFPLPISTFAALSYSDPGVKIFIRSLGRLAEVLKLSPDSLRQVVRIHYLYGLLVLAGQDLDGTAYRRGNEDTTLMGIASFFTLKHIKKQSQELTHCYMEWIKAWGGRNCMRLIPQEESVEKVRAAMIFWRRNTSLLWEDSWKAIQTLEQSDAPSRYDSSREGKFFN
jgi:hypothetical protein